MRLAAALLCCLCASTASAQGRRSLLEHLSEDLRRDEGFTPEERSALFAAIRDRFAGYANDVVSGPREAGARVAMRMIVEGQFDEAPPERMAEVAFAAYQAVSRGAPPDVVEGIALYGYRKRLSGDKISLWANGYNDMVKGGVPPEVASDLVRNAMEHGWEDQAFNIFKWALVAAAGQKFNVRDYAVYLFGTMLQGKKRPGAITAEAHSYFRKIARTKEPPVLPPYEGAFSSKPAPEAVYEAKPEPARPPAPEPPPKLSPAKTPEPSRPPPPVPEKTQTPSPGPKDLGLTMRSLWPELEKSAVSYLGTPYVWGGTTRRGIDCSALTQNSYAENRIRIPRVSKDQHKAGEDVYGDVREGDLVFFDTKGIGVSHVGMVVSRSDRKFIHASSSRGVVIDDLDKRYYKSRYLGARRIVP